MSDQSRRWRDRPRPANLTHSSLSKCSLQIEPGPNNPLSNNPSITYVTDSDSLIIVPMFDASTPITSGQTQVLIVGFMQVFIHSVGNPQNTVYTTIINVTRCSSGGGAGSPPPPSGPLPGHWESAAIASGQEQWHLGRAILQEVGESG